MPKIFETLDKIRPAYDVAYKVFQVICKLLLIADILIATYTVWGRWCQTWAKEYPSVLGFLGVFKDPSWSEEVILTCMSYMAVLAAALAIRRGAGHSGRRGGTGVGHYHAGGGLEVRLHPGRARLLRVYALAEPVLDVFPGTPGGRRHDRLRAGSAV